MKVARRPTTAFSASITIHFFSTSAGFSEAVVFIMGNSSGSWAGAKGPRRERADMPTMLTAVNMRRSAYSYLIENRRFNRYGNILPLLALRLGFLGQIDGDRKSVGKG